jgi:hypothetical protein
MSLDIRTHIDEPTKSKLAIGLWQGDECVGRSEMDADGLDRLIVHLAQQREKLATKVPMTLEGGERIRGQREPEWMCVFAQETDDQVLALRHAGFGWLGFQLSVKTARAMATALLNSSSRIPNGIIERRSLHRLGVRSGMELLRRNRTSQDRKHERLVRALRRYVEVDVHQTKGINRYRTLCLYST